MRFHLKIREILMMSTRDLNDEIPFEDKHFTKRKGVNKFETRSEFTSTSKSKQRAPQSEFYYKKN